MSEWKSHNKAIHVNTVLHMVPGDTITYERLRELAYPGSDRVFSATAHYPASSDLRDRIVWPGQTVAVVEGASFGMMLAERSK